MPCELDLIWKRGSDQGAKSDGAGHQCVYALVGQKANGVRQVGEMAFQIKGC